MESNFPFNVRNDIMSEKLVMEHEPRDLATQAELKSIRQKKRNEFMLDQNERIHSSAWSRVLITKKLKDKIHNCQFFYQLTGLRVLQRRRSNCPFIAEKGLEFFSNKKDSLIDCLKTTFHKYLPIEAKQVPICQ